MADITADRVEQFLARVDHADPTACWVWPTRRRDGYGIIGTPSAYAHRFAFEALRGPIPEGLQLDHLCRNRGCVNPAHLEPVTPAENTARGSRLTTHCPAGHPYSAANTYTSKGKHRMCRECGRRRHRERERALRALNPKREPVGACVHGHPFDSANTYVTSTGTRQCRACHRAREAARRGAGR